MRKFRVISLVLLTMLLLCGCQDEQLTLADMSVTVEHELSCGINLTLPDDWQVLSDTEEAAAFCNADNSLSLGVGRELAGFSYYSADGVAELGEQLISAALQDCEILAKEVLPKPDNAVLVTASGKLADGEAVCQAMVVSPLSAVRYFIVVTANSDTFSEYSQVLRDIYATFEVRLSEDELYEKFDLLFEQ